MARFCLQKEFTDLNVIFCEMTLINNPKHFWLNLQRCLAARNDAELRVLDGNYDHRHAADVDEHRKLLWSHLFSDEHLQQLADFVAKTFPPPLHIDDDFIIKTPAARQEINHILLQVAQQNGFQYNHGLDDVPDSTDDLDIEKPKPSYICCF
jgi:hypothetical protein